MIFLKLGLSQIFKRLLIVFSIIVCSLQGAIFTSIFEILHCNAFTSETNGTHHYIHSNLSVECFTPLYYAWVYFFILPALFFYVILLPLIFYIYMNYNKDNLYDSNVMDHVGFLINGYRKNKHFWEFVFFFRRLTLHSVVIFLEPKTAAFLVLIVLIVSLILQMRNQPFLTRNLNSFEYNSNIYVCCILTLALFSESITNRVVQTVCIIVMIIINCFFLIRLIRVFLILKLNNVIKTRKNKALHSFVNTFFTSKLFY